MKRKGSKLASAGYLLKEGIRNIWSNRTMSLASIGVLVSCLLLTGSAVLLSMNINQMMASVEGNNSIQVYCKDEVSSLRAVQIREEIASMDNVEECELVLRDEAVEQMLEQYGDEDGALQSLLGDNFLPHAFKLSMKDLTNYQETADAIMKIDGIDKIIDYSYIAEQLTSLDSMVNGAGMWIVIILSVVSLFIISNTIRVTMFSRQLEISIMKSVGATNAFITIPFLVQGMFLGLFSAALASGIIWYLYYLAAGAVEGIMPTLSVIPFSQVALPIILIFVGAGVLTGTIGSAISIRRHLKHDARGIYDVI